VRAGRAGTQIGDGTNLFDITYAGNAASAFLLAAEKLLAAPDGVGGEDFFISDGNPQPIFDVSREIARLAGQPVDPKDIRVLSKSLAMVIAFVMEMVFWVKGGVPPLDRTKVKYCTMNRYFDITKARERLGYAPAVDWKEGMRRGVEVSCFFFRCWSVQDVDMLHSGISRTKRPSRERMHRSNGTPEAIEAAKSQNTCRII